MMRAMYKSVVILIAVIFGVCSMVVFRPILSSTATYSHEMERLDSKRNDILALAAASSVASTLLTVSPGDVATPLANQLADLSKIFLIILSVVITEKYLLTLLGSMSTYLILLSCAVIIVYNTCYRKQWVYNAIIKILILAVAFGTFIPISIKIMDKIEDTHKESIDRIVNNAIDSEKELEEESESSNKNVGEIIAGAISDLGNTITGAAASAYEKAKESVGKFIEAAAVMVVTSCVIPLLTLVLYAFVIRYVFGLNFEMGSTAKKTLAHYRNRRNLPKLPK